MRLAALRNAIYSRRSLDFDTMKHPRSAHPGSTRTLWFNRAGRDRTGQLARPSASPQHSDAAMYLGRITLAAEAEIALAGNTN
ncbi:MAG: hypothetical protein ACSHXD_06790 [Marinosulfonomonas sp.]